DARAARPEARLAGEEDRDRRDARAAPAHRDRGSLGRPHGDGDQPGTPVIRAGRAAVAAWLLLLAACGPWLVHRLVLTPDMSAFLPPAATGAQEILMGQMRSGVAWKLLLVALEGAAPAELVRLSSGLAGKLPPTGLFDTVANGDRERVAKDLGQIFA